MSQRGPTAAGRTTLIAYAGPGTPGTAVTRIGGVPLAVPGACAASHGPAVGAGFRSEFNYRQGSGRGHDKHCTESFLIRANTL
ncbi:predicted protein [Streptomyces sp. C]|nr:predicted protein [Streptomyces sp. C]